MKHRIRASTPPVVTRRKHTWETTPGFGGMPDLTIRWDENIEQTYRHQKYVVRNPNRWQPISYIQPQPRLLLIALVLFVTMNNVPLTKFYPNIYVYMSDWFSCSILLLNPPIFPSLPCHGDQLPTVLAPFHSFVVLSIIHSASSMWHGAWSTYHPERIWLGVRIWWLRQLESSWGYKFAFQKHQVCT